MGGGHCDVLLAGMHADLSYFHIGTRYQWTWLIVSYCKPHTITTKKKKKKKKERLVLVNAGVDLLNARRKK